jgi:hypothetical protein
MLLLDWQLLFQLHWVVRLSPPLCMHTCCNFDDPAYVLSHGNVALDECHY